MKRILLLMICAASVTVYSQGITDAVRYAQDNLNGSARFSAMGGAFGALGGDFSATSVNPAGSVIFMNNQAGITLSSFNIKNKSNYFGTKNNANDNDLDLNQGGIVYIFENDDEDSEWTKFSIAMNYENTNNFDDRSYSSGNNTVNSVANYFLSYANMNGGVPLNILDTYYYEQLNYGDQQAFLGYQGYIINPVADNPDNTAYVSNVPVGDYYQQNSYVSAGYNGKASFNFAAQYKDRLYFGLNLNTHFSDYRQSTSFTEINDNSNSQGVRSIHFDNELRTFGRGFSFQLGVIGKITPELRAGFAYDSPTWYDFFDRVYQYLETSGFNYGNPPNPGISNASPYSDFVFEYPSYQLTTPAKYAFSAAYVFGKRGLLSIDYSIKDYSRTRYRENDNSFGIVNDGMSDVLTAAGELRIGGELRAKEWSFRGGYRNQQSPYKNSDTIGDLNGFSTGLGYDFGNVNLDLSYTHTERDSQQSFFSQGFTDTAKINSVANNVSVSVMCVF